MRTKWLSRIGRMGAALYLIAVIALGQALFSVFSYVEMHGNPKMALLSRGLAVVFLLAGLLVLGWESIERTTSTKALLFVTFCASISTAFLIFAVKGFSLIVIATSLNPETFIATNFFNCRDIAIYFLLSFVLILAVGVVKNLRLKSDPDSASCCQQTAGKLSS